MPATGVIPTDVADKGELEIEPRSPDVTFGQFALQRGHDALRHGVIERGPCSSPAGGDAGPFQALGVLQPSQVRM